MTDYLGAEAVNDEPKPRWWVREWRRMRQSVAFFALLLGFYFIVAGALIFISFAATPPKGMALLKVAGFAAVGLAMAFGGVKTWSWGYRNIAVRTLNELAAVGLFCGAGIGIVAALDGATVQMIVASSGMFLGLSICLFIIGRIKAEGEGT
jgi:hypothetical protein